MLSNNVWHYSTAMAHTMIQEYPEEQAHPENLSAICRSTRTLHLDRRHGNDLEDVSRRQMSAEDRQTQDGVPYKWSDYVHKLASIILSRHGEAKRIICLNDPYDTAYSTKDDERDLRVQSKALVPNTYMKLATPSPQDAAV